MEEMIPLSKPSLGSAEEAAVLEVLRSGWLMQGPRVQAFEADFCSVINSKHSTAVFNGTIALQLALQAAGVKPGEHVITVSHSHISTANCVRHVFAEPLFIDIAPDSYNISVNELERFIEENCDSRDGAWFYKKTNSLSSGQSPLRYIDKPTGRIAAILAVHQMGFPCSIHQISLIADRLNVPLIEDAACSIGSEIIDPISGVWRKLGSPFGLAACFSFHPRKVLTTGEGGMIATNDAGIDGRVKLYRAHYAQKIPRPIPHEQHLEMGYNFRLTDLQAAVGIEQLKRLPAIVKERAELAANYYSLLSSVSEVRLRDVVATEKWNWQSFPIEISSRSEDGVIHLIEKLQSGGVSVKQGIMNAHEEPTYQAQKWRLPQSESRRRSTMLLPFFNGMTHVQQRVVVQKLKEALI